MQVYGIEFETEKRNKEYCVYYKRKIVAKGKTKKQAEDKAKRELYKRGRIEIISLCAGCLRSDSKGRLFDRYAPMLKNIFGFTVPVDILLSAIGHKSLDVIRLDRMLRVPLGQSMKQYIKNKFGVVTARMVGDLI